MRKWLEYLVLSVILVFAIYKTISLLQDPGHRGIEPVVPTPSVEDVGSVDSLIILPLFDRVTSDPAYLTGNGLSYLLSTPGFTLLMDLGSNDGDLDPSPLQQNMATAGISITNLDALVITHDHPDHVGGQKWWNDKTYSFGSTQMPLTGLKVYLPEQMEYPGVNPVVVTQPRKIAEGIVSIGVQQFENSSPMSFRRPRAYEQALAVNVAEYGVVLISGGGHAGLEWMLEQSEQIFHQSVVAVVGGLDYQNKTRTELQPDFNLLRSQNIQLIAVSPHNSDDSVLQLVAAQFPQQTVPLRVGEPVRIEAQK